MSDPKIIDGNLISKQILEELKVEIAAIKGPQPRVTFVRVGEDPASVYYVNKKQKTAMEIGIDSSVQVLPENTGENELLDVIDTLNNDTSVHGILIQSPLPDSISEEAAFNRVHPDKDVDGLNIKNFGRLCQEDAEGFVACTPVGIIELLKRSDVGIDGKHAVVVGRSLLVGKSCALLLMQKGQNGNATVSICHSHTQDLSAITKQADILIAAMGKAEFITEAMVKSGAVVIDVGINRVADDSKKRGYRIVGDVDFDNVLPLVSKITPVPGGVGPMTVAILMRNTLKAYKKAHLAE